MKSKVLIFLFGALAILAVLVGFVALNEAKSAKQLALSEIIVEEVNSISTPVFDQDTEKYSYLTLYDVSVANVSGPGVVLKRVSKSNFGSGFLVMLKGQEIVSANVGEIAFVSEKGSGAIKNDPRLLKVIGQEDMGETFNINSAIAPGETKVFHLGLRLNPYDETKEMVANMALVSFIFEFDTGKSYIFQRGFPIYPIQ